MKVRGGVERRRGGARKLVLVVAADGAGADPELERIVLALGRRGVDAVVTEATEARRASIDAYDGLVIAGAGAERLAGDPAVMQLVGGAVQERKPVVALADGAIVCAQTELLAFHDATCAGGEAARAAFRKHHVRYVDVDVVEAESGIVTARSAEVLPEVVHVLAGRLGLAPEVSPRPSP